VEEKPALFQVRDVSGKGPQATGGVARSRTFDLDDIGAVVG
jgi:hypothetical protein